MEQRRKYNTRGTGSAGAGRLNGIATEVLILWVPALIVGFLILSAFPL